MSQELKKKRFKTRPHCFGLYDPRFLLCKADVCDWKQVCKAETLKYKKLKNKGERLEI